jgi:hypothetical protein
MPFPTFPHLCPAARRAALQEAQAAHGAARTEKETE